MKVASDLLRRGGGRLRASLRPPPLRGALETAVVLLAYALVFALPAQRAGLVTGPADWGAATLSAWTPLRVLLTPALVEELIFRVLPNPHPSERRPTRTIATAAVASLAAYVAAHPLAALLRPGARDVFLDPVFLLATTVLGASAWALYRRWGSLWLPVALHAAVVWGWLHAGGAAALA